MQEQHAEHLSANQIVDRVHAVAEAARMVRANVGKVIVGKYKGEVGMFIALKELASG